MKYLLNMLNTCNKLIINNIGRDVTEYISSNTMNVLTKKVNPFIWTYDLKALVIDIYSENSEVITVTLLPNQHWKVAKSGQYIELKIFIKGKEYKRAYSISSIKDNLITITIKKCKEGVVSNWLHKNLIIGMTLDISGPFGDFIYKCQDNLLFICAGSGITPCFSIVNELLKSNKPPDIIFFAQYSKVEDIIFSKQIDKWANEKIKLIIALSKENIEQKLSKENFKDLFPDFKERSIYLCGPEGFMNIVTDTLEKENYNFEQLFVENFIEKQYKSKKHKILSRVYFKHYNKQIQLTESDQEKSLLEIGIENGLNLERGCKKGICGTCKLILHEGSVEGNKLGKAVYICTAFPNSELVVLGT